MCHTTTTHHLVCCHTTTSPPLPCFQTRHPALSSFAPFAPRCHHTVSSLRTDALCAACLAVFTAAGISELYARRLVLEWRRREGYEGVLVPVRGMAGVRMMFSHEGAKV